ncbi:hypothetical protein Ddc_16252 [Ditylenchus destructor]|nr:hypothetical protein Ddc_16252 [Ditylenchus destructor]
MSCSKPLPPFNFDVLYYLNRDELERFTIVCRPLKNFIERYFHSKPYRVFSNLRIRGGSYALFHKNVDWHPNRDGYSVQQFLAGQKFIVDKSKVYWADRGFYSFVEMRPYLGPTIRIKNMTIYVGGRFTYNPEHIAEMEFISYLWSSGTIFIQNTYNNYIPLVAIDFQPILSSSTIMKCHQLYMDNAYFSFKDYKALYAVDIIYVTYHFIEIDDPIYNPSYWPQFLEQPGVKPVVSLNCMLREHINNVLDHLSKTFSSAVSPNAFKIAFAEIDPEDGSLTEFRITNNTSGEILELKEGFPPDRHNLEFYKNFHNYILERSSI